MSTVKVRSLRKSYGNFEALKGISFNVKKGEIVGFLGPNGAGKTTTMKILTCYMAANGGEAIVGGHDCASHPLEVRQSIGYLPENNPLYPDMKVFEYLRYMAELHDLPEDIVFDRIKRVADDCGLLDKINDPIHSLSKGYKQRVGLAVALIHDPEILILDEPTVGLDPNQIVEIRHLIKKLGKEKTVLLSSHLLAEVELTCNRLVIIDRGSIVASGTPYELKNLVEDYANLKLVIRGDKQKSFDLLRQISGVKDIQFFPAREKGGYGFGLVTARNRDPRPEIARLVVENDLELLEMHRKNASLEKVFSQVTGQNN